MHIIGWEIVGTALLILLGDGVVAAVLLNKSKAQNSGWIVITFGWGMAVMVAVYRRRPVHRRAPQPRGHARPLDRRRHRRRRRPEVPDRRVRRRLHRRRAGPGVLLRSLPRDRGPGPEARGVLDRAGDPQLPAGTSSPRSSARSCWCSASWHHWSPTRPARSSIAGWTAAARRPARSRDRPVARRSDRLRDQPGARPGPADHARDPAGPGQGPVGLGLLLGPGRRAAHRRRSGRRARTTGAFGL